MKAQSTMFRLGTSSGKFLTRSNSPRPRTGHPRYRTWFLGMVLGCLAWPLAPAVNAAQSQVTTARLLREMTDLRGLAEFPNPPYTCKQFSSYDRKAKSPTQDWFANNDRGQYLRVESHAGRQEYVMLDAAGPGAIVRIWSANPAGTLRIYLDGAEQPVIESPMAELLGGKFPGLPRPIAGEYSKGWNLYFPIAYAKHCKVTSDKGDFYYHVNYRTYAAGTPVETFRARQLQGLARDIQRVAKVMGAPRSLAASLGGAAEPFELELAPGDTVQESFWGPMAFTRSTVRVTAANLEAALRGVVVRITFDGERTVEAPLGDLFGSAPGLNPYATLPLGMTDAGEMYSHWFMPFKDTAEVALVNYSKQTVTLTGELALADYTWTESSMHFHAKWRGEFDVPTRPMQDWNYLTTTGRGVFAGVAFAIDNPVKDWWGEGDEKIYVDGERFPSHFGTGTEDYYGYAWCWPVVFTHAYHAQPRCDGPRNYGRTSVNRFHVLDRIPFTHDFRFDMELWHWNATCKVNLAVVAYWYARPGGGDAFPTIRPEQAVVRPMPAWVIPHVKGALEGETMRILKVAGTASPQDWDGLSAGRHLWWHAGMKPGDELLVAFPAPKAGRYRVLARFLTARDYGVHQLAINGRKTGEPMDFYHPDVRPTKEIDLGVFDLRQKNNRFSAKVVGANPKAVKSYMFGLDYLLLKPAD